MRLVFCFVLALCLPCLSEEEAEKVFRTCNPSVVGLENLETSGTGIIVSTGGLILTNAHVLSSPLKYRVLVDVASGTGGTKTVVFNNPKVVGYHPEYDLALLRINPAEQNVRLTPARILRAKAGPGKRVYAIGNPAISGMTLTKSITDGMLSAADREMEGLKYYQFSAPINPGNSGGPLLDKDGNVLGLVTFKMTDADGVGFAIPLHDFDSAKFQPVRKGRGNAQVANLLIDEGTRFFELGRKIAAKAGKDHEDAVACRVLAFLYLRQALSELPESAAVWSNVGLAWVEMEEDQIATAYYIRSVQLDPWLQVNDGIYWRLSKTLLNTKQEDNAALAWREGAARYPREGMYWSNLAVWHYNKDRWEEAAYHASCGLVAKDGHADRCRKILADTKSRVSGDALKNMEARIAKAEQDVQKLQDASDAARKSGKKKFLVADFEKFVKAYEESNGMPTDEKGAGDDGAKPADPAPEPAPAADAAAKWIASKLNMAKSYHKNLMDEKALPILQEILDKYPDHPDSKEAKRLLEEWKKK